MDAVTNILYEALNRYFHTLSVLGYKSYNDVNKLLVLSFIEEILTGEMSYFISEDDLKILSNTLNYLQGSTCLIDYKCHINKDNIIHPISNILIRYSEDDNMRISEDNLIKVI